MKNKRLPFILLSGFLPASFGMAASGQTNFIIINLDDSGYGDFSVNGALNYLTPNIDRMAAEGMRFTHFLSAQPVSSASRAGLLTGCYSNRIGFAGALFPHSTTGIAAGEETIAEVLKKKGYRTGAFGKWHLGHHRQFLPLQNGFDEYFGLPYSNDMLPERNQNKKDYPPLPLIEGNDMIEANPDQSQLTTRYTEKAVDFLQRSRNTPFFIYLAHSMPHIPLAVSDKFKGKSRQGLYGDVMMEIDWSVGQILEALRRNKLEGNTLVIVTSDNGPWLNFGNHGGSAGGLREGKNTTFEGGNRVACIMQWKGTMPAGTICNRLCSQIDLLPTFAAIAGAPLPPLTIDGVNILPLLKGDSDATPREFFAHYFSKNNLEAISGDRFKLIFPHNARTYSQFPAGQDGKGGKMGTLKIEEAELYDLRRDPGERYNVIDQFPEEARKLSEAADRIRARLGDDLTGVKGTENRPIGQLNQ